MDWYVFATINITIIDRMMINKFFKEILKKMYESIIMQQNCK